MTPTVLIVEDEADILLMERLALEAAGLRVIGAASAEEALPLIERAEPDVVVLDIRLPEMSGWELLAFLRNTGRGAGIPVVVATADASPHTKMKAAELGCHACLIKPFSMAELTTSVTSALDEPPA